MNIAAQAATLVAGLNLKLVHDLTSAMRAVNRHEDCGPLGREKIFEPRPVIHPTPRFEPRVVYHPTSRFEPRPVIHPRPQMEPAPSPAPVEPEPHCRLKSPIQPPWKVCPWENPIQPPPKIKVNVHRTDVVHKGSLIDMFI